MTLLDVLKIRLSPKKRLLYEAQAASQNQALSAYIRDRLEAQDDLQQQLLSYQHDLSQIEKKLDHLLSQQQNLSSVSSSISTESSLLDQSLLIESLLLLRTLVSPADRTMMQSEIKRLGYPLWTPQKVER